MVHDGVCPELAVVGPGSAGTNPDHGGVMVTVGVQINVECQIRLRDPLALHHHLLVGLYGVAELSLATLRLRFQMQSLWKLIITSSTSSALSLPSAYSPSGGLEKPWSSRMMPPM